MISYPNKLNIIFDKLKNCGIKSIIVGGFVRDSLLGIESKDIDVELYGKLSFEELEGILKEFGTVNVVGKSFGVCKLKFADYDLDFSFPRRDNKVKSGHRGFEVQIDLNLDFKTATSRRDFTINSIGYDVIEKKLLDPFGGVDDLKNKILKAVNPQSFGQDPLRVLRAAQFYARFELKIEHNLSFMCKDMVLKYMLDELPKERVYEEIKKLLLKSREPSRGFKLLKEFGSDIYTDNLHVVDEMSKLLTENEHANIVLMFAALCYNFNQTQTENFILKLTSEKELLTNVTKLLINKDSFYDGISDYELYKLATKVNLEELLIFTKAAKKIKQSSYDKIYKRAKELSILKNKLPAILSGGDIIELGLKPSPIFSEILNDAYEAQMLGGFKTYAEAKLWLKNYLKL